MPKKSASELKPPITEFTVILAKAGLLLYQHQRVMDSGSPLRYGWNDGLLARWAFFSIPLANRRPFRSPDPEKDRSKYHILRSQDTQIHHVEFCSSVRLGR
jgi:hypothetical protein